MTRQKLTITIDEKVLKKYKKYCEDNDVTISRRLERYMKKDKFILGKQPDERVESLDWICK